MFDVGQKVVFVGGPPDFFGRPTVVEKGVIYTVASVFICLGCECITLLEVRPVNSPGWYGAYFRPIVDDKKSVSWTMGADPDSEKWDNRRKVPAPNWSALRLQATRVTRYAFGGRIPQ